MLHTVGAALYKRATIEATLELPWWSSLIVLANLILFIPLLWFLEYTLHTLYPIFVIVEDENPPAYEPLIPAEQATQKDGSKPSIPEPEDLVPARTGPISSSIRSIFHLLRANGGFFANFRGSSVFLVSEILTLLFVSSLVRCFGPILGLVLSPLFHFASSLLLVQFSTVWVHIVITPGSDSPFWKRLPPFTSTLKAVWRPMILYSVARILAGWIPVLVAACVDFPLFVNPAMKEDVSLGSLAVLVFKYFLVLGGSVFGIICLIVPAKMILVRIQASLLPVDEDAIVPFDRSFGGRVETLLVGGRGFATIADVWSTFSHSVLRRLAFLYLKLAGISVLVGFFIGGFIIFPEVFIVLSNSRVIENN